MRLKAFAQCVQQLARWACLVLVTPLAQAAWVIGQPSDFSGPTSPGVRESTEGAKLYFKTVNAKGGVHGQVIELRSVDDHFDPAQTRKAAEDLIQDPSVLALFLIRGTPNTEAVLPLLSDKKIALVAPSTGAMSMHSPVHPWVFNVRASYRTEAERTIAHLGQVGITRVGIILIDNSFGEDALKGALEGLKALQQEPVLVEKFAPKDPDFAPIVAKVSTTPPQAVVFIGAAKLVALGIRQLREAGYKAQIATLSNNASSGFVQELGANARGVMVSQVFPNEHSLRSELSTEAMAAAKAQGMTDLTPSTMEGYAAAKVLVEALRRAGPRVNRAKLRDALESLKDYDLGGLRLSYSPTDHSGLSFVDLSIISSSGRFMR